MSFLLCCLLGNKVHDDNLRNVEKNKNKIQIDIKKQSEGIQINLTKRISSRIRDEPVNTYDMNLSKNKETLIQINDFEKIKCWFSEVVKHTMYHYEDYKNKKELCDYIFKTIDLNTIIHYYKKYNNKYNNINSEDIIIFCKDNSNIDFINDIKVSENIYIFH